MPPPKAQPPRKRSGQRTVWQLKRWKAGDLVKRPADGVNPRTSCEVLGSISQAQWTAGGDGCGDAAMRL